MKDKINVKMSGCAYDKVEIHTISFGRLYIPAIFDEDGQILKIPEEIKLGEEIAYKKIYLGYAILIDFRKFIEYNDGRKDGESKIDLEDLTIETFTISEGCSPSIRIRYIMGKHQRYLNGVNHKIDYRKDEGDYFAGGMHEVFHEHVKVFW